MSSNYKPWDNRSKAPNGDLVCYNFRDWFGDSKVVDAEGEPLVVYHGTSSKEPLTHFDRERQGQTAGVKGGFFFTSEEEVAREVYAWRGNDQVVEAYLKIENPLTLKDYFKRTKKKAVKEMDGGRMDPTNYFDTCAETILAYAHKHGHDGLVFKNESGDQGANDMYIVFDTHQIKSATANSGLYLKDGSLTDRENLKAVARATTAKAILTPESKRPKP